MTRDEIVKQLRDKVFAEAFDELYSGAQSEEDLRGDNLALYVWRVIDVVVMKNDTPEEAVANLYAIIRNALLVIEDVLTILADIIFVPQELECLTAEEYRTVMNH
jgi:hypothetical protein